ncbi:cytochrome o ubiquinol oxidase subunit IV [Pullulanibacillus camelliae]|uniref:Cytochrome o ubiquinol oxidase subunit IV n=1 Tax=Pullulanibacillus camelliae TaxID=1707096 RepID=A0A8J3E087_9BACL|nr:cytochrome o ubiquinol oxidase subunit IV [Pullulanibacillus camelliae]GGE50507.1 cytochrome o ubiquinol oxidase subunit IV [Pullulanibacillus camelliae]
MKHIESRQASHGSTTSYIIGFVLSILLTILPLWLVVNHVLNRTALIVTIMIMAALQFLIQLLFFMHIRESEKPRYNVLAIILGIVFVITIVGGSAWIMTFNSQVQ